MIPTKYLHITGFILLLWLAFALTNRIKDEGASKTVEIAINWDETQELLERELFLKPSTPIRLATVLERLRILGVSSVVLRIQTIGDLASSGKILFFSGEEIEKLKALGLVSDSVLKQNLLWVRKDSEFLPLILQNVPGTKKLERRAGDFIAVQNSAMEWEKLRDFPLAPDPEQLKLLRLTRLFFVTEPMENCAWDESFSEMFSGFMEIPGGKGPRKFVRVNEVHPHCIDKYLFFENEPRPVRFSIRTGDIELYRRYVKAHTVAPEEIELRDRRIVKARWVRAVKERSCRFLYFRWNPQLSLEENLRFLRELSGELKSAGFKLARLPRYSQGESKISATGIPWKELPLKGVRLFLAFLVAIFTPCAVLLFIREKIRNSTFSIKNLSGIWLGSIFISLLGAFLIPVILPDTNFVNGLDQFRGVKASLLLPFLIVPWLLFSRKELSQFLTKKVSFLQQGILLLVFLVIGIFLIRSGNFGLVVPLELEFRLFLEELLGVRPRFKEFLIGHPLMLLGIYLMLKVHSTSNSPSRESGDLWPKLFLIVGALAPISIVNSFCHLHTPILVSLLRTFHGVWIGGLLGVGLILSFSLVKRFILSPGGRKRRRPREVGEEG